MNQPEPSSLCSRVFQQLLKGWDVENAEFLLDKYQYGGLFLIFGKDNKMWAYSHYAKDRYPYGIKLSFPRYKCPAAKGQKGKK
jgi:hypothetical protein